MNVEQFLHVMSMINGALQKGKVEIEEVVTFFESKGADADEIAAIRAQYTKDIADETIEAGGGTAAARAS